MSWRARTSVNEATTLAKAVHRWQAGRARPRCAATPAAKCCNTPCHHPHACGSSIASATSGTCIKRPSTVACRVVLLRRCMKPPRLLRLCIDGRPAEHGPDAPPRRLAPAATAHVALCTCVVAASTQAVTRASNHLLRWRVMACTHVGERSHHACLGCAPTAGPPSTA